MAAQGTGVLGSVNSDNDNDDDDDEGGREGTQARREPQGPVEGLLPKKGRLWSSSSSGGRLALVARESTTKLWQSQSPAFGFAVSIRTARSCWAPDM